jgi:hypothetical protein
MPLTQDAATASTHAPMKSDAHTQGAGQTGNASRNSGAADNNMSRITLAKHANASKASTHAAAKRWSQSPIGGAIPPTWAGNGFV